MHPIATRIDLAPGLRLDLLTPTTFRLRRSCLQPDPFPEAYEVPFAMAGGTTWEPVPFTRAASCGCATIATEAIVIHISGESLIVEAAGSGRRIFPSLHPRHGLCRNGCMVFDAAGPPDAPTTCSRFSHWFHNPATGLHDIYLPGDDLHDLFFIYGPDYPALFRSFNRLVGPEPLLTRKGYGFYQTQHLGFIGNQQMLMRTVAEFRQRGIPLDTVILDFEWGDGSNGPTKAPWGSRLAWSSTYCSPLEPAAMIAELSRQHVEVMLIHHSIPDYPGRHDESWTCQASPADVWWKAMDEKLAQGVVGTWQDTRQSDITNHRIHAGIQQRLGDGRRAAFLGCHQVFLDCNWTHQTHPLPTQQRIGGRRVSFALTSGNSGL
jgi:alpha-glucosidase (family GH31 glycosyl hydrolase)